jgi:hypothetical protein
MRKPLTFAQLVDRMPAALGGLDPLSHKTPDDLAWMARHEIDLYEEGEESDIGSAADLRRAYLALVVANGGQDPAGSE